jgi:ketosteroid isomerase-like protein
MKKHSLIVIVFFILISYASAQTKPTVSQEAVQNIVLKIFDALANRDTVSLKMYCSPDITLYENGMTWNLDTLIQGIKMNQATDFKRINTIDFIDTKVDKDIAWTTYNNQAEIIKNGKHAVIKWIETVILVKDKKSWKVKVLHSTLIKRT